MLAFKRGLERQPEITPDACALSAFFPDSADSDNDNKLKATLKEPWRNCGETGLLSKP